MAHTKSAGSSKYGRDSQPKYLGVKKSDGSRVKIGDIVIRQRGAHYLAGEGIKKGGDDTLFAIRDGIIKFHTVRKVRFDRTTRYVSRVEIVA